MKKRFQAMPTYRGPHRLTAVLVVLLLVVLIVESPHWLSSSSSSGSALRRAALKKERQAAGAVIERSVKEEEEGDDKGPHEGALRQPASSELAADGREGEQRSGAAGRAAAGDKEAYTPRGRELQRQIARGKRVEWLHLPKTGTSFGNTLLPWVCPRLHSNFTLMRRGLPEGGVPSVCLEKFRYEADSVPDYIIGDHVALVNRSHDELSRVFTLVRSPLTRLPSGFHHVHRYKQLSAAKVEICEFVQRTRVVNAAWGTQVRMIAGDRVATGTEEPYGMWRMFGSNDYPSPEMVDRACARLRRFAFVGLTEHFDVSVCLFHELFGGTVRPNEYKNVRSGFYRATESSIREADCGDTADEELYQCAAEVFRENLRRHPKCLGGLTLDQIGARPQAQPQPAASEA